MAGRPARSYGARALAAWPTLLKIGFAESVAYRAEFLIWMLSTTMPLVMLALMSTVAAEQPIAGYGVEEFTTYYLLTLLVRTLTGAWVVWEMTHEIRQGTFTMRLLRPIHPFVSYASDNLAALPLRSMVLVPLVGAILFFTPEGVTRDPAAIAIAVLSIAGAWLLNFLVGCAIACLAFFVESAIAVFEVWLGAWMILSGYLIPLDLFPAWLLAISRWLPFRLMLDLPVRTLLGRYTPAEALEGLLLQWAWIAGFALLVSVLWRKGLRRFEAYGG